MSYEEHRDKVPTSTILFALRDAALNPVDEFTNACLLGEAADRIEKLQKDSDRLEHVITWLWRSEPSWGLNTREMIDAHMDGSNNPPFPSYLIPKYKSEKDLENIFLGVVKEFSDPSIRGPNFTFEESIPRICYTTLMPELTNSEISDENKIIYTEWFRKRTRVYLKEKNS